MFVANALPGPVIATSMATALEEPGDIATLAPAPGGAVRILTGGPGVPAAERFYDGTALPTIAPNAGCAPPALGVAPAPLPRVAG